jgi:hypothetical protein
MSVAEGERLLKFRAFYAILQDSIDRIIDLKSQEFHLV